MTNITTRSTAGTNATVKGSPLTNAELDGNFIALNDGKQEVNANLTALAGLTGVSDRLFYFTGAGALSLATYTAFARTLTSRATAALVKADLALENVDNTSDANKPVSSAQLTALNAKLNLAGGKMTGALNEATPVSLASAATVAIGAAAANSVTITGTTTITAFDSIASGATCVVTFAGALTLTHNATSLQLPGSANITTTAGDTAEFVSLGAGNWDCLWYQCADGQPMRTVAVNHGGTGATTVITARSNLGLGTAATYNTGTTAGTLPVNGAAASLTTLNLSSTLSCVGDIYLNNGTSDGCNIQWNNGVWNTYIDLYSNVFRIWGDQGGAPRFAFQADMLNQTVSLFGAVPWTNANFNPNSYLTTGGKAADSDKLDGLDSGAFVIKGQDNGSNNTTLSSGSPPPIALIAQSGNSDNVPLTITNQGNGAASAVIQFHRIGSHAAYFGLDTDNLWKVGGRSMGNQSFILWHDQQGLGRIAANSTSGAIGTYMWLRNVTGTTYGGDVMFGGNQVLMVDELGNNFGNPAGTWRSMGPSGNGCATLFLRVS